VLLDVVVLMLLSFVLCRVFVVVVVVVVVVVGSGFRGCVLVGCVGRL
jgi:hypothetical protein